MNAPIPAPTIQALTACPITREWPLTSHLTLPGTPLAVPRTRLHTRDKLAQWHVSGESAELVVSELVTNAVRAYPGWTQPVPYVRLRLSADHDQVLVQVWDANDALPVLRDADPGAVGGRGLLLVDALSEDWGAYRPAVLSGKVVWAIVAAYRA